MSENSGSEQVPQPVDEPITSAVMLSEEDRNHGFMSVPYVYLRDIAVMKSMMVIGEAEDADVTTVPTTLRMANINLRAVAQKLPLAASSELIASRAEATKRALDQFEPDQNKQGVLEYIVANHKSSLALARIFDAAPKDKITQAMMLDVPQLPGEALTRKGVLGRRPINTRETLYNVSDAVRFIRREGGEGTYDEITASLAKNSLATAREMELQLARGIMLNGISLMGAMCTGDPRLTHFARTNRVQQQITEMYDNVQRLVAKTDVEPADFYDDIELMARRMEKLATVKRRPHAQQANEYLGYFDTFAEHSRIKLAELKAMTTARLEVTRELRPDLISFADVELDLPEDEPVAEPEPVDVIAEAAQLDTAEEDASEEAAEPSAEELRLQQLLAEAQVLVDAQQGSLEDWRFSKRLLKDAGLSELTHALVVGAEGESWDIAGQPANEVHPYVSLIYGIDSLVQREKTLEENRAPLTNALSAEQDRQNAFAELQLEYMQLAQTVGGAAAFPKITETLGENIDWLNNHWLALEALLDEHEETVHFADSLSSILQLERAIAEDVTAVEEPGDLSAESPDTPDDKGESGATEDSELTGILEEIHDLPPDEFVSLTDEEPDSETTQPDEMEDEAEADVHFLDPELIGIALQEDWEAFPGGASYEDVETIIRGELSTEDAKRIDWSRLKDLYWLKQHAPAATLYRTKPHALGTEEPYYAVEFKLGEEKIAVADNVIVGNATYVIREATAGGTWRDVMRLPYKRDARVVGAVQVVHRSMRDHRLKIVDVLQGIMTTQR